MKVLVTGGCGFIGSNFIRHLLLRGEGYHVINLDALTYAGNEANLEDLRSDPRYTFVRGNICDRSLVEEVVGSGVDAIVHFAAESHVDRSILFPEKVIPLFVSNALEGRELPLYGDGRHVRDWLFVDDHCEALERVLRAGRPGETYNIGAGQECTNLSLARMIVRAVGVSEEAVRSVTDRPAHDQR